MLKENIERLIANTKFESNKSLFAREANLNRDEVVRILSGKIKNPGIYTVSKIANVLNCSIDDLLGGSAATSKAAMVSEKDAFQKPLFLNALNYILEYIEQHGLKDIKTGRLLQALDYIYSFSCHSGTDYLKEDFAKWFCKNSLK
jgi:transcriptional regulator with XRE-family HTH domain